MNSSAARWDDLRTFLEVARQGSVHAAAKRLKVDHSTVSRRIERLESLLSLKLLDRTRKGIAVRPEAQALLAHIKQMDVHASALEDSVGGTEAAQTVRIATMEGIASCYLAKCLASLPRFAPNVRLELVSIPQTVDLSRKEADIFLSFFDPKTRGLNSALYGRFSLFLYCSPEYIRRHGIPRSREDLQDHVFVGYIDDLLAIHAVRWLDELIPEPEMSFTSNSVLAQCNAAVSGLGIVLLPTFVAAGIAGLQRILPESSVQREVWVSVRIEQSHLRRITSVTRFLQFIFERDADFLAGKPVDTGQLSAFG
jgi:DNA-binding transcriptional LysR family regulator